MEFYVQGRRGREGGVREKEKKRDEERKGRRGERLRCHWRKEEKGYAVSFRGRQPHSPTHKVDKKEKDRTAMRLWFTPRRMTDPLSGTSFNTLMDEWTNVDYHRSCIAPQRFALSLPFPLFYSRSPFLLIYIRHCRLEMPCVVASQSLYLSV